ncbi:hypothetical protein [Argonema galeatum]|uniref:hypothetical protein n=1 Tax=Argonema galeatum TaxID=2942762 RepID=UPI00201182D9|nr:hypothetical protein [Argonema galeatum]MCL1465470.1 hypothetical protein [Argonema galeatum A003/A1]
MTRFPHDQFAKDYLKELLTPLGQVETSRNVAGEVREIDVWFTPSSTPTTEAQALGLLGRFATTPAIFEPFRNAVTSSQIRSCMSKLFDVQADIERQAKRESTRINESNLPKLWILTPTGSPLLLDEFRAICDRENWLPGVYFLGDGLKTAIVAIHQLPLTPETLWLRILGKGKVQKQAIDELTALPADNPLRANALELLYNLRVILETNQNLEPEDRELIMELSPLYLERLDTALQSGIQQGERLVVENLLRIRFGNLDDELKAIIEPLLKLPPEEFTRLLLQLSRDELLARFSR